MVNAGCGERWGAVHAGETVGAGHARETVVQCCSEMYGRAWWRTLGKTVGAMLRNVWRTLEKMVGAALLYGHARWGNGTHAGETVGAVLLKKCMGVHAGETVVHAGKTVGAVLLRNAWACTVAHAGKKRRVYCS